MLTHQFTAFVLQEAMSQIFEMISTLGPKRTIDTPHPPNKKKEIAEDKALG